MTETETRLALRRQFVGSVVVALMVMAATGLTAMRPAHGHSAGWTPSHVSAVQQPTFVAPPQQIAAVKQNNDRAAQ